MKVKIQPLLLNHKKGSAVASIIPVAAKHRQGQQLPTRAAKSKTLLSTDLSNPKPATNQTRNDSTSEDEDEDIHETVGSSDPEYREIDSYDDIHTIMPWFKPSNDWNKDVDGADVINIFRLSKERHRKDTKDNIEWVNHKTHPTKKEDIIQAYESSFSFIDHGIIPSDSLISQAKYCIPNALLKKLRDHQSYDCVLDHPLCNIPLDIDWLFKPVSNLVSKIQATQSCHST